MSLEVFTSQLSSPPLCSTERSPWVDTRSRTDRVVAGVAGGIAEAGAIRLQLFERSQARLGGRQLLLARADGLRPFLERFPGHGQLGLTHRPHAGDVVKRLPRRGQRLAGGRAFDLRGVGARLAEPLQLLVDRPLETLFHGRNQWVAASLAKVRSSGKTDNCVDTEVFVEGLEAVSVNLTTVPLKNLEDQPIGYLMVMEDITAEKRLRNNMSRYMSKAVVEIGRAHV